jgi:RsmE family RNA methyltransferase
LLSPEEIDGAGRAILRDRRAAHVREVLGARVGQPLRVGLERGPLGTGVVRMVSDAAVELEVHCSGTSPAPPGIDLVLALPRPKVLARVLRTAATFGVGRIDVINAWRVDKSYWRSRVLAPAATAEALRRGCEQGMTTWVPVLHCERFFTGFLARAGAAGDHRPRLVAHPGAENLSEVVPQGGPAVVAIGPEGGWIEREVDALVALGFRPVSLGARVLSVEAAVAALLAQLELLQRLDRPARVSRPAAGRVVPAAGPAGPAAGRVVPAAGPAGPAADRVVPAGAPAAPAADRVVPAMVPAMVPAPERSLAASALPAEEPPGRTRT